ncbi:MULTISPECIES: hypothetical protein [unclassified Mycolicibacterium]|uniref:hypothetical protein n=1 Tax=unclassified Mycolicibacterium TaxID=2636767 RepID=UPI002EDA361B
MNRILQALVGGLVVLGAVPAVAAHAAPAVPDFSSYPKVAEDDYTVRPGLAYSVRGFRTPSGLYCTSSNHRAMYAVNCTGPLVGAPDGTNWVNLFESGNVVTPVKFTHGDAPQSADVPQFEGHPINLLPKDTAYAFDDAICVWTDTIALACRMGSGDEYNGFIATTDAVTTFGNV